MVFNLKKHAQDTLKTNEKAMQDQRNERGWKTESDPGNYDWLLQQENRKSLPNDQTYESQLKDARNNTIDPKTTEAALDSNDKLYLDRRLDKYWNVDAKPNDILAEAFFQEKLKAFRSAQKKQINKTPLQSDNIGEQLVGKKTTVKNNVPASGSQLHNHQDRMKGIDKTQPIEEDANKNEKIRDKEDGMKEMVMASLKDADAMIFYVHAKAARENRELDKNEQQMITDITSGKVRLLQKIAQGFYDDEPDNDFGEVSGDEPINDIEQWENEQAFQDGVQDRLDSQTPDQDESNQSELVIEPADDKDGFWLVEYGDYPSGSVLEGRPQKKLLNHYQTLEEAQKANPNAQFSEMGQHSTRPEDIGPNPPDWYSDENISEPWDE